jgi:predicted MPP superfamily phosphohydrolase
MNRHSSAAHQAARRLESGLYGGGWVVRLARTLGIRPRLTTTELHVELAWPPDSPRLRIGYASDFHAGPTTDPDVFPLACEALRTGRPNVVLLGGDFVNFKLSELDLLLPDLERLASEQPCFAVLGNHDWLADAPAISRKLEAAGIEVLTNRNVRLQPPFAHVWICGLDDHWCGSPDADQAFLGADGTRIVLMHAPSGRLDIGDHRFDLALCGHTHGGQIALPGGRPLILPNGRLSRRYSRGSYQLAERRTLFVSRGVGCAMMPVRMHADAEVVACTVGAR